MKTKNKNKKKNISKKKAKKKAKKIVNSKKKEILKKIYCGTQSSVSQATPGFGDPDGCTIPSTNFYGASCSCCN